MTLSVAKRRKINRANAKKSTGPKTAEGKAVSRENSTIHGMRSEVLAMSNEDPVEVASRTEIWNDYYKPESPGAQHLVNACVQATFLSDRVARSHDETVASQVRGAEDLWFNEKMDELEELKAGLIENPSLAVRLLRRKALGCDHLAVRWGVLTDLFVERRFWCDEEVDEAIHMIGFKPTDDGLKHSPDAFKIFFYNDLCFTEDRSSVIARRLTEEFCPDSLWKSLTPDTVPDQLGCQKWIVAFGREQQRTLAARGRMLAESIDLPDRGGAKDRALILHDEKKARLFLRYAAEARNGFQRAFGTLLKTLDGDKETAENSEEYEEIESSPIEANSDSQDSARFTFPATENEFKPPDWEPSESKTTASPIEADFEAMEPKEKEVEASPGRTLEPVGPESPDLWREFHEELARGREAAMAADSERHQSALQLNTP